MRPLAWVVLLGGCSLYFNEPEPSHHVIEADAGTFASDAGAVVIVDAAPTCPFPGTSATIGYPADGATNVAQPIPIQYTLWRPLDDDEGVGIYLADANGDQVPIDGYYDADCSSGQQAFPTDPETWTQCYTNLGSGATYSWHVWITCYDSSGIHEIATSTFTTAP